MIQFSQYNSITPRNIASILLFYIHFTSLSLIFKLKCSKFDASSAKLGNRQASEVWLQVNEGTDQQTKCHVVRVNKRFPFHVQSIVFLFFAQDTANLKCH